MSPYPAAFVLRLLLCALCFLQPWVSADRDYYEVLQECSTRPFICGDHSINVSYPFSGSLDAPAYCGHPGFHLQCNGTNSDITISMANNKTYVVQAIDYDKSMLAIVDEYFAALWYLWHHVSNGTYENSCMPFGDTVIDPLLFELTDLEQRVILFQCSENFSGSLTMVDRCVLQNTTLNYMYISMTENASLPQEVGRCSGRYRYLMNKMAAKEVMAGYISFLDSLHTKFTVRWTAGIDGWCRACRDSGGVCVYDSTQTCYCPDGSVTSDWCHHGRGGSASRKRASRKQHITLGSVAGVVGLILFILMLVLYAQKGFGKTTNFLYQSKNTQQIETMLAEYGSLAPKRYKYSDLKKITKSFHEKLGKGGYGSVFKGTLQDGRLVAVKTLSNFKENGAEFINEVISIGRTSHVNVVSLLGFCFDGKKRALVYEFLPNGSLEKYIYSEKPKLTLGWDKLYHIAIGIARGLEYLHRGCSMRIVHFDIKPHNILLDEKFCPKISDFGLAKLCPQKESILSMADARGTIGFIAPEVISRNFGAVSTKSDVYIYGMMILEMVGGRKNVKTCAERSSEVYFPHWVYEHLDQDKDLQAYDITVETEEIARKMTLVGLWCIQIMPENRPSMTKVVEMLEGQIGDMEMPPKPSFSSPIHSEFNSPR